MENPLVIGATPKDESAVRPIYNVRHLPASVLDHRSPVWIGNLLLVIVESVMFCILVGAYFYIQHNYEQWPPPQVNRHPPNLSGLPDLLLPTINLVLMLISVPLVLWTDLSAFHRQKKRTERGLFLWMFLEIVIIALRWFEFQSTNFRWDDNAYAAVFWTVLGLHLMHLFIAFGESVLMTSWIVLKGMDDKHARDVRVTAVYWYWIVGTWVPLYLILFLGPHLT